MPTLDAILETMEHLPVPPVPIIPWPFVPRGGQRHAIFEHPERDRVLAATMSGCGVATLAYNNTEGERDILATIADEKAFYTSLTICPGANLPADRSKWKSQYAEELDSLRTLLDDVCEDVGSLQFVVCNFENQRGLDGGLDVKAFTRYLYDVEYACKQIWPQCVVVWYGSPLPTLFPSEFLTDLLCPSLYYQGNLPLNREAWSEYRGMGIMRACNKFVPFVSVCSGWPSKGAPFAATPGETGSGFAIASMLRGIRDDNVHCLRAVALYPEFGCNDGDKFSVPLEDSLQWLNSFLAEFSEAPSPNYADMDGDGDVDLDDLQIALAGYGDTTDLDDIADIARKYGQ